MSSSQGISVKCSRVASDTRAAASPTISISFTSAITSYELTVGVQIPAGSTGSEGCSLPSGIRHVA